MYGARPDVVPLTEAAERLELSTEAVRKRIQRGTLPGRKVDGAWWVEATHLPPASTSTGRPDDPGGATERQDGPVGTAERRPDDAVQTAGPDPGRNGDAAAAPAGVDLAPLADVIASLTRENRELAAAAALWQERARTLEGRLLALADGDAPADAPAPAPPPEPTDDPRPATEALMLRWRRWFRRMADG